MGNWALKALKRLDTQALGHVGHLGTWALGHSGNWALEVLFLVDSYT